MLLVGLDNYGRNDITTILHYIEIIIIIMFENETQLIAQP